EGVLQKSLQPEYDLTGERVTISLLGDGLLETIDLADILKNAKRQRENASRIHGSVVEAPVLESRPGKPAMQVGRFGWKSQHSSLLSACADSMRNELGVRNHLYPDEYPTHKLKGNPSPFEKIDSRTGKSQLDLLVDEIRHTLPP